MKKAINGEFGIQNYRPSKTLIDFMDAKLRALEHEDEIENAKKAGRELPPLDQKERKRLNKKRNDMLRKVFQSMADLTYFLEMVAANKALQEDFERELDDLFGLSTKTNAVDMMGSLHGDSRDTVHDAMIERLLAAILLPFGNDWEEKRVKHVYLTMRIIRRRMSQYWPRTIEEGPVKDMPALTGIRSIEEALNWIQFAYKWTELRENRDTDKEPRRTFTFPHPYDSDFKKKTKETGFY